MAHWGPCPWTLHSVKWYFRRTDSYSYLGHGTISTWPSSARKVRFETNTFDLHCISQNLMLFCKRSQSRGLYQDCQSRKVNVEGKKKKDISTDTVSRVLGIPKSFTLSLITQMAVDQAPKKMSMCQHLNSAVARRARKKVLSWAKGSGKEGAFA